MPPSDKAAMLEVKTNSSNNLHESGVYFQGERNAFALDHQHDRRDVMYKPAIGMRNRQMVVVE